MSHTRILKRLFPALLVFAAFAFPADAQFIGYTSPQTFNQKIFSGQTTAVVSPNSSGFPCTPTNGSPCAIQNLGQSIHAITYTITSPCTTGFFMDLRIEATQNGTDWFSISEDATDQNSGSIQGANTGGLTAIGSYAGFRLNLASISCASGETPAVTVFYSGTSTSTPTSLGTFYQSSGIRKLLVQNLSTTLASSTGPITINAPNENTAGGIYVSCFIAASGASTSCPAGMTITVDSFIAFGSSVGGGGGGNVVSSSNVLNVAAAVGPIIQVPNAPAISITFRFSGAGTAGVNWSIYYVATSTPTSSFASDPCQSSGILKLSAPINITSATTTQIIALISGEKIYVCGGAIDMAPISSGTVTATFEYGTGASCGTGTTALTGAMPSQAASGSGPVAIPLASGVSNWNIPVSDALCILSAGTGPTIQGWVSYVQQ